MWTGVATYTNVTDYRPGAALCTNRSDLLQLADAPARGPRRRRSTAPGGGRVAGVSRRRGGRRRRGQRHADRHPPDGVAVARPQGDRPRRVRRARQGAGLRHHRSAPPPQRAVPTHERLPGHPVRPGGVGPADGPAAGCPGVPAAARLRDLPARDPGPAARRQAVVPRRAGARRRPGRRWFRAARARRAGDPRQLGGPGARQPATRTARGRRRTAPGGRLAPGRPVGPRPADRAGPRCRGRAGREWAHRGRRRHHAARRRARAAGGDDEPARPAAGRTRRAELHRLAQPGPHWPGDCRPARGAARALRLRRRRGRGSTGGRSSTGCGRRRRGSGCGSTSASADGSSRRTPGPGRYAGTAWPPTSRSGWPATARRAGSTSWRAG